MSTSRDLVSMLPHRPPMLLLDQAELTQDGSELTAVWNVPKEDPVLDGHFPDFPIWPGALLLESMAQTTAVYLLGQLDDLQPDEMPVLGSADVRFLSPVLPGDTIYFTTHLVRRLGRQGLFSVRAVNQDDRPVARAKVTAGITSRKTFDAPD
ncbi:MAG: 3-hydroxyacyl-ACP dehydratase FabZ family protein [Acidobacteriota bacterium]